MEFSEYVRVTASYKSLWGNREILGRRVYFKADIPQGADLRTRELLNPLEFWVEVRNNEISIDLPDVSSSDLNPRDFTFTIREDFDGGREFSFLCSSESEFAEWDEELEQWKIDLSTVRPIAADSGIYYFVGPQGIQGERGEVGPEGARGERGPQGPQGLRGVAGDKGDRGDQGLKGDRGEDGIQGPTGEQGEQGVRGDQGETGPEGPQGLQGVEGPEGPVGPQGDPGPVGPAGPAGAQGPEGPQGVRGYAGPQGERGYEGPQGVPGPQGQRGEVGPTGDAGPQGSQGIQGDPGDTGPQGPPGTVPAPEDYFIVGPGRPDQPSTTGGLVSVDTPTGATYISTDGGGVQAWKWFKTPDSWITTISTAE